MLGGRTLFPFRGCQRGLPPQPECPRSGEQQPSPRCRGAETSSGSPRRQEAQGRFWGGCSAGFPRPPVHGAPGPGPQHSPGCAGRSQKPGSEPRLPAAPVEAEAVGAGSALQAAGGQEAPQGGAGAQVTAAAQVEALWAWPPPRAAGHLEAAWGRPWVQPEDPGCPGLPSQTPLAPTCLSPCAPLPLGSGDFLDIWRIRVTKPRPGQLLFRSPRDWAGAGPDGRGPFRKVGTGRRFSAERARSNLGEGQRATRKRQASEQSPGEREREEKREEKKGGADKARQHCPASRPLDPNHRLTCICRGNRSCFFLEHFGIKVPEVSCGGDGGAWKCPVDAPTDPAALPGEISSPQELSQPPSPVLNRGAKD